MGNSTVGDDNPAEKEFAAATSDPEAGQDSVTGKPWMYKPWKIGPLTLPWFAHPMTQLVLVSFVCFLCPGMFNAVSGLGGGGQVDATDVNKANTALYSTFAVVGFFAGSIANRIGLRLTLSLGGFGYFLYVASLLSYNHNSNAGFLVFSGALLGVCAGLLWCAQGAVMMSYPREHEKGKYICIFWVIFNLGGVIGSLVPLGQNLHSTAGRVNDGTYIAFMVLMAVGFVLAWGLSDSKYIMRSDRSRVIVMKNPSWKSEFKGLLDTLRSDYYIVLMFPLFLSSNWFYGYHFNSVNGAYFNVRTRSLNSCLYWLMQMVGAFVFGFTLDMKFFSRSMRAKINFVLLFLLTLGVWGGGYAFQRHWQTSLVSIREFSPLAQRECGRKSSYNCVFPSECLKPILTTPFHSLDLDKAPFMTELASCWGLLLGSLLVASPIIFFKIKDHVDIEEDLKFSDETAHDVMGNIPMEEQTSGKKEEKRESVA
ncbi:unnamed protein product [Aspergillus oryzae]|uniref:Unnamed protein product n=2 Tax=Aspergillus oryzae TaxID=5062 RepID=A0AAN4YU27_ASPOZ|nr:unnamed protein product [Aspergillus oryzae]GMF83707.1 unnamed protein product [Aspergillus oryzae]GMG06045.1 unnamed protein product [Aspergillus oryzae]GMG34034.1 unnamed protein product [Aspergillus oryzae]GMG52082.1 unnamed protein product [Aspergillus oryzae var. brunneus]